ncbi:MAG: hypothetical protein DBY09_07500 [Selenomonadales bacterium]|jgi:hypothetical protein|nr:MAG: hypothetical protein DBY09_07500 [Selenomonadales bacterium]
MKRAIRYIVPFLGTALAVLLSFVLPKIVLSAQDERLEFQVKQVETAVPPLEISFFDRLQFFTSDYTTFLLETDRTEDIDAAYQSVLEILSFFAKNGFEQLNNGPYYTRYSTRFLALSQDGLQTALVWDFSLVDKLGNTISIQLDNESEKLISLYFTQMDPSLTIHQLDTEAIAQRWADACVEHYGLQTVNVQTIESDHPEYRLTFTDIDGGTITAHLYLEPYLCSFYLG